MIAFGSAGEGASLPASDRNSASCRSSASRLGRIEGSGDDGMADRGHRRADYQRMDTTIEGSLFPARHWHALPDGRIQCDVCPRFCKLHEGQRGLCFVRARQDDALVLTTYGRSSGFCIDPIEKKPLNHFLPGTPVFSFGTAGCNLTCKFCQNWDISKAREIDRLNEDATPAMIADAARQLGCRSVAFTYNDPVIFLEYAVDTARACHDAGLKTVAVTAGYITPEARGEFYAAHRRGERRSEGLHRAVLSQPVRRPAGRCARHAGVAASTRQMSGWRSPRC